MGVLPRLRGYDSQGTLPQLRRPDRGWRPNFFYDVEMTQDSAAKREAQFIARFDPAIAKLARASAAVLRKRFFPTAVELVYDNYRALAIGWGPNEHATQAIVSLAIYTRGINLYFIHGAKLDDPERLLQGNGTRGRFLRLESVEQLDDPDIVALLRTAIRFGKTPLPATGKGRIVIRSVSAKQRPRRPAMEVA